MRQARAFLSPLLEQGATTALLLFLSVVALIFVLYQVSAIQHPYPLDYGEAPLVDQAMHLVKGQNIYNRDLSSPPYTVANYLPVYVIALTPFVKLLGPGFSDLIFPSVRIILFLVPSSSPCTLVAPVCRAEFRISHLFF